MTVTTASQAANHAAQSLASRPTLPEATSASPTGLPSRGALSDSQVDHLWLRLTGIYGHRWTSAYGDDPRGITANTWARTLADLSQSQLSAGLHACALSSDGWPPSLPEFRAMCLGVPTFAAVRLNIASGTDSRTPFARLVWEKLDDHAYRLADQFRADRMLRDAYDLAREFVMHGGQLPAPVAGAIEQAEPTPIKIADPEAAKRAYREVFGSDPE